jgi:hypothetical protein
LKDYLNNLIPAASFVEEVKSNPNQNFGRWSKKMDLSIEKEKNKSFFTRIVDEANRVNISGRAANISKDWNNKTQDQKQNELSSIYQGIGLATKNDRNKKDAYGFVTVDAATAINRPVTISKDNPKAKVEVFTTDGKRVFVPLGLACRNLNEKGTMLINGVKYTTLVNGKKGDTYTTILDAKVNGSVPVIDNRKEVRAGYYSNDGNLYNVSTDNLNTYINSSKKTLTATTEGNSAVYVDVPDYEDPKTGEIKYKKELQRSTANIIYTGDLNDISDRAVFDYTQGVGQQSYVGGQVKQSTQK